MSGIRIFPARAPRKMMLWGWASSTAATALLVSGLAVLIMSVPSTGGNLGDQSEPLMLTLSFPPALTALPDPAPDVATTMPDTPDTPITEAPPHAADRQSALEPLPAAVAPNPPSMALASNTMHDTDIPVAHADVALPKPTPESKSKPESGSQKKIFKKPAETKKTKQKPESKPAKHEKTAAPAADASSKPRPATVLSGKNSSIAASYPAAVMKKIRGTKKKAAEGRGIAVVGFIIAKNGEAASVSLLRSSGNALIDKVALDHIRRASPFPPPPEGALRQFSFEFASK